MPKGSSKAPKGDLNTTAFDIIAQTTAETSNILPVKSEPEKNPTALALGRLGSLKGGRARAEKLSVAQSAKIAKKATVSRWSKA